MKNILEEEQSINNIEQKTKFKISHLENENIMFCFSGGAFFDEIELKKE